MRVMIETQDIYGKVIPDRYITISHTDRPHWVEITVEDPTTVNRVSFCGVINVSALERALRVFIP
jgi:hypothetical protein